MKTFHRWNLTSGEPVSTTALQGTNADWQFAAASPDGSRLALATGNLVDLFDTRTGHCVDQFQSPVYLSCLEFSPDGRCLAIGGDNACTLWDIAGRRVARTLAGHQDLVSSIKFSPDQTKIATTSWDHTVRLWDAVTGKPLAVLTDHKAATLDCVFSPDGRTLVTSSDDLTMKFWNMAALREVGSIPVNFAVSYLAFSPDEKIMLANNGDSGLRCWRTASLAEIDATETKEPAVATQP
jgi:WD40 repeat protein